MSEREILEPKQKPMCLADAAEILARRKLGEPDEWKAYKWEMLDAQGKHQGPAAKARITGGIPVGVYTSGENKGHPIWKGKGRTATIPIEEVRSLMKASSLEQSAKEGAE